MYTLTQLHITKPLQISKGQLLDKVTVYMRKKVFLIPDLQGLWKTYTEGDEQ